MNKFLAGLADGEDGERSYILEKLEKIKKVERLKAYLDKYSREGFEALGETLFEKLSLNLDN